MAAITTAIAWTSAPVAPAVAAATVVINVTSPTTNAVYILGGSISINVAFDAPVTVTGTPQLLLETGSTDRAANYASGSGTSVLTFRYTVQLGDASNDLDIAATSALSLNGGTIRDGSSVDAVLTVPSPGTAGSLGANKDLVVDGSGSTSSIVVADNALTIGETSLVTITFSEAVTGFTNADLTIANGTLGTVSSGDGGQTWTATLTPSPSIDDATNVITLDMTGVQDAAGEHATVTFTFSEAVTGFAIDDVTVEHGTLGTITASGGGTALIGLQTLAGPPAANFTATFTPDVGLIVASNAITVSLAGVSDASGNPGAIALVTARRRGLIGGHR